MDQGRFGQTTGVGGEVDRGQVAGEGDGEHPGQDGNRIQPGGDEVATGVADRHPAGRDRADHRGQRERRQHRRQREQVLHRSHVVAFAAFELAAQGIGGATENDADGGDEQRDGQGRHDGAERDRVTRPGHGQHEDQPDVVGLPDWPDRVPGMVTGRGRVRLPAAGQQRPQARAEVGSGQHGVGGDPDQDEHHGHVSQHGDLPAPRWLCRLPVFQSCRSSVSPDLPVSPASPVSSGTWLNRRSSQNTAPARPR